MKELEILLEEIWNNSKKYRYVGNCVDQFDLDGNSFIPEFCDVSDFAVQEENSESITETEFHSIVEDWSMVTNKKSASFLITPDKKVVIAYDSIFDIHYFFTKT